MQLLQGRLFLRVPQIAPYNFQTKKSLCEAVTQATDGHVHRLLLANLNQLEKRIANEVALMPGNALLKNNPSRIEHSQVITMPQVDFLEALDEKSGDYLPYTF